MGHCVMPTCRRTVVADQDYRASCVATPPHLGASREHGQACRDARLRQGRRALPAHVAPVARGRTSISSCAPSRI